MYLAQTIACQPPSLFEVLLHESSLQSWFTLLLNALTAPHQTNTNPTMYTSMMPSGEQGYLPREDPSRDGSRARAPRPHAQARSGPPAGPGPAHAQGCLPRGERESEHEGEGESEGQDEEAARLALCITVVALRLLLLLWLPCCSVPCPSPPSLPFSTFSSSNRHIKCPLSSVPVQSRVCQGGSGCCLVFCCALLCSCASHRTSSTRSCAPVCAILEVFKCSTRACTVLPSFAQTGVRFFSISSLSFCLPLNLFLFACCFCRGLRQTIWNRPTATRETFSKERCPAGLRSPRS